jgi:hypothetical protein
MTTVTNITEVVTQQLSNKRTENEQLGFWKLRPSKSTLAAADAPNRDVPGHPNEELALAPNNDTQDETSESLLFTPSETEATLEAETVRFQHLQATIYLRNNALAADSLNSKFKQSLRAQL